MAIEHFPVEAGHVLMFARAIGDPSPTYAALEGGAPSELVAVPPTFVTAQRPVRSRVPVAAARR